MKTNQVAATFSAAAMKSAMLEQWIGEAWRMYQAGTPGAMGRLRFVFGQCLKDGEASAVVMDPRVREICEDADYLNGGK